MIFHIILQYDPLTCLGIFMSSHYSPAVLSPYISINLKGSIIGVKQCT